MLKRIEERQALRPLARAGCQQAIFALSKRPSDTGYFSNREDYRDAAGFMKDVRLGPGYFSWVLSDEEGRLNLNTADAPSLGRLFKVVLGADDMQAQELAASIIDWRDADSELSIPVGSAEDDYYTSQQYPYKAKNMPFEVPQELLLVKGMTREAFEKLFPYITVYGDGKVNANTASLQVLVAVGLDPEMAAQLLNYRKGDDETEGTADDRIFETDASIVPKFSQSARLNDADLARLTQVAGRYLGVNSQYFRITSSSRLDKKGSNTYSTECIIDSTGAVQYWQQP